MVGEEQQPAMEAVAVAEVEAAGAGQHYQRPQWPSVEHCNDVNKVSQI